MTSRSHIYAIIALVLCLLPFRAQGQLRLAALRLPTDLCAGSDLTVGFGYNQDKAVLIARQEATLGHSDQVFLPDGEICNGSCAYRSPVTFDMFNPTDRITSVEDIKFVRIKIEHSFIGDIYMGIECPNGQKANLMRFSAGGTSSCDNMIPESAKNWLSGNNISEGTFFGRALDTQNDDDPCNASASGNEPGIGWNYCWSSNTTSGYHYASGDGIIYRDGHAHHGIVDSSNVAAHTNFYHPDESFSSLVGCPLNGTWNIVVVDGYSVDNGYIFEWELTLDASLIPGQCLPQAFMVEGGDNVQLGDSTFRLVAPVGITADTAVEYLFRIATTCGDTIDTAATIVYHPLRETSAQDTVCDGTPWAHPPYSIDSIGHYDLHFSTVNGCDSLVHLDLAHWPSYDRHFYDSICVGLSTTFEGTDYDDDGDYTHRYTTVDGCDSLLTLHLTVLARDLKAVIRAKPLVVDFNHLDIELRDESRHSVAGTWTIAGATYSDRHMTLRYPEAEDSLEISLEAVSREGCSDTTTVMARYDRAAVYLPNAFTPTEGENDRWRPSTKDVVEMEVWIYNRLGLLVAHWDTVDGDWDGGDCPPGAYVCTVHYRTRVRPDWKQILTGTILLIK